MTVKMKLLFSVIALIVFASCVSKKHPPLSEDEEAYILIDFASRLETSSYQHKDKSIR